MRDKQALCEKPLAFRVPIADMEHLAEVCVRLDLDKSEILRRCVRVGLEAFKDARLPGVAE